MPAVRKSAIPVLPHLKKFVLWKENLYADEPLSIGNYSFISYFVSQMLVFKKDLIAEQNLFNPEVPPKEIYTEDLLIAIPPHKWNTGQMFITKTGIKLFNNLLHKLFYELLIDRIFQGRQRGLKEKDIIYDYMRELEIEELYEYESIKRTCTRIRTGKGYPTLFEFAHLYKAS